jgi:hypothetical protein
MIANLRQTIGECGKNPGMVLQAKQQLHAIELLLFEGNTMSSQKKFLLLRTDAGDHFVCEEYDQNDYGRVHVLEASRYGTFNRDEMSLEFQKVSHTIAEIIYEGYEWPDGVQDRSATSVKNYFLGEQ